MLTLSAHNTSHHQKGMFIRLKYTHDRKVKVRRNKIERNYLFRKMIQKQTKKKKEKKPKLNMKNINYKNLIRVLKLTISLQFWIMRRLLLGGAGFLGGLGGGFDAGFDDGFGLDGRFFRLVGCLVVFRLIGSFLVKLLQFIGQLFEALRPVQLRLVDQELHFSVHGGHFIGNGFDGEDGFLVHRSLVLFGGLLVQPRLDIDKKDFKK